MFYCWKCILHVAQLHYLDCTYWPDNLFHIIARHRNLVEIMHAAYSSWQQIKKWYHHYHSPLLLKTLPLCTAIFLWTESEFGFGPGDKDQNVKCRNWKFNIHLCWAYLVKAVITIPWQCPEDGPLGPHMPLCFQRPSQDAAIITDKHFVCKLQTKLAKRIKWESKHSVICALYFFGNS